MSEAEPRQKAKDIAVAAIDIGDDKVDMGVANDVSGLGLPRLTR